MKFFYLDRVMFKLEENRAIPTISCWNSNAAMQRERNKIAAGGFRRGTILERLQIKDSADEQCSMNPLALALLPPVVENDKIKVKICLISSLL